MLKTKHYILHIAAAFTIAVMLCAAGHPAKGAGKYPRLSIFLKNTLRDTTDTLSKAADSLKASADTLKVSVDSLKASVDTLETSADSLKASADTLKTSVDSLAASVDSLAVCPDSLTTAADSLSLFPNVPLSPKELKRKIKDSIWAYKDSVIRATPRLLETYLFADSIKNQRMFLWKANGYFNTQELLPPDTTYNDNFNELPYKKYDVDAIYLGVAGSAMQYTNWFKRSQDNIFPFFAPYMPYTYTPETMPFYNVKSPYTELAYWGTLFANKQREETNIKFLHTQNFTPSFNFSILYQREGGNGMLENERTDTRTFAITGNHIGKRYVAQGGYIFSRVKRAENGGVADLSMVMDTIIDSKTIPVALKDADTKLKRNTVFITHSYGIPFNFRKRDSLAYGEGTMAYLGHTGEYSVYTKTYNDEIGLSDSIGRALYNNAFYINPTTTADSARAMNFENRVFIRLQPWAKEAIVSKLDAGIGFQMLRYYNFSPDYFLSGNRNHSEHNMYLYFGASGQVKKYFAWEGFGSYHLSGYNQNDFKIGGKMRFSAYPLPKGIHLTAKLDVSHERPAYYYNSYFSNHYIWDNHFEKTTSTTLEGRLDIPDYRMEVFFGYALLNNNIYLDSLGNAAQNGEAMSVMSAYVRKDFKLWKFHLDHKILFQLSSKDEVVPLPKLALNLRYYLEAPLVKNVLTAQLGVEATFNTKYHVPAYSPALGLFYNQQNEEYGENPYLDVFVNLQWKRASIFVKYVNAAQNWPTNDYFSACRYLKPQTAFKLGIHWPFYVK